jgi:hypothetical protein
MVLQTVLVMNILASLVPRIQMLTYSCLERPRRTTRLCQAQCLIVALQTLSSVFGTRRYFLRWSTQLCERS